MLTNREGLTGEDEQAGEHQSSTGQAHRGGRSAGDPAPAGISYMGPTGLGVDTRFALFCAALSGLAAGGRDETRWEDIVDDAWDLSEVAMEQWRWALSVKGRV